MRLFRLFPFSVFSLLSAVHVSPMSAQQRDSAHTLPEIVVTATRTPLPREAVTASVTVLEGALLRARGLTTVADALRDLPEAAVVRTGSPGGQTGLFLRGGESNFTLVLLDGVPVNDPGGSFDFATLTLDGVARIEVVRGPASVLYGSDAVSGVINVITAGGRDGRPAGDVAVRYGTYGALDVSGELRGAAGPAAWNVAAARHASDGLYPFNNRFENLVAGGGLGVAFGRTRARVTGRYADGTYRFPTNSVGVPVDSNQYQTTETVTLGAEVATELSGALEAVVHVALNRLDGRTDDQPDAPGDGLTVAERALISRSADLRVNARVGAVRLTLGSVIEGEHERTGYSFLYPGGAFTSSFDETRRNVGGYAQATAQRGPLALNGGVRLDDNQRFGTFVTARGGAAYRLATGTRLRASAGSGFKEPTFFENYGGSGIVGNADLAPEQAFTWELGVEQPIAEGRVRLEATWFAQRFTNLIEFVGAPAAAGAPNYLNVAGASSDGLELSADARLPLPDARLAVRYTRLLTEVTAAGTDPTFVAGQALVRRPGHAFSARLDLAPVARVRLTGGVRYTGGRADLDYAVVDFVTVFDPARVSLPGYALFDVGASWTARRGFTLDASVGNLFDVAYEEVVGFRTPGRTVSVGGRVTM